MMEALRNIWRNLIDEPHAIQQLRELRDTHQHLQHLHNALQEQYTKTYNDLSFANESITKLKSQLRKKETKDTNPVYVPVYPPKKKKKK